MRLKKILVFLVVLVLALAVAGCNTSRQNSSTATKENVKKQIETKTASLPVKLMKKEFRITGFT